MTMISHALPARPMGQAGRAAGGADVQAGGLQLPDGAAPLVPALLGYFTLGYCHI